MERTMRWAFQSFLAAVFFIVGFAVLCGAVDDKPSPELIAKGKELFTVKTGLGTKLACILCHQGDKAIPRAKVEQLGDALPDEINKYIVEKAKGTALPKDSEQMKALAAYILHEHSK